jgi:hypothetical protein
LLGAPVEDDPLDVVALLAAGVLLALAEELLELFVLVELPHAATASEAATARTADTDPRQARRGERFIRCVS